MMAAFLFGALFGYAMVLAGVVLLLSDWGKEPTR